MTTLKNIAVALAATVIFSNITNAQQAIPTSYSVNYEEPLAVKYIGTDGDYLTFQVSVQSANPAKALFEIADKNEGELYSSSVTNNLMVKTIKVEKRDNQVLDFKLVVGRKTFSKSFSVNTNRVETTTVAESDITML